MRRQCFSEVVKVDPGLFLHLILNALATLQVQNKKLIATANLALDDTAHTAFNALDELERSKAEEAVLLEGLLDLFADPKQVLIDPAD